MKNRTISILSMFLHLLKLISLPIEEKSGNDYWKRTNTIKIRVGLVYLEKKKKVGVPADYKVNVSKSTFNT